MQVNDVNIQAFTMSMCHQMNTDTNNEKQVKGIYALVLQGHQVMKEAGLIFKEMDEFWCKGMALCLVEILAVRGMPPPPNKKGNVEKMVKAAVRNVDTKEGFYLATTMADFFELRKVKEEMGL